MSENKTIRPLGARVIVKRLENAEKTASGLFIPDSAQEKQQQGEVVSVGKGTVCDDGSCRPMDIAVGDVVVFGKYSGNEIKVDGQELLIMKEDEIYGVMEA